MVEQTDAVQRMQDYIEAHLEEELTLAALSQISHFSPWHSYRLFREYTGLTVSDYIRRLRLSKSALKLKDGQSNVTDAAMELGFGSVDGYIRAFRRVFGCSPGEYARNPVPITLFVPYGVKYKEKGKDVQPMNPVKTVYVQLLRKPERKVILKRGKKAAHYWDYCEEVGCDVWGILMSMGSPEGEPVCLWLPKAYIKPGTSSYVQGVEVSPDYNGIVPEGFDVITLPEKDYLMFQGEPFQEEDYCDAIAEVQHAMETYRPEQFGLEWDDSQPRIQLEPRGERGYIELRAVKTK